VLSTVQNRMELFAVELQEEKSWLVATLLWAAASIFLCGLAIIFVVGTLIFLSPESWRPWLLIGLSVVFVWMSINAVVGLRRSLREKGPPMADSIGELKKDIQWIRSQD
jgi:uncharacterized membrane protein YqjE